MTADDDEAIDGETRSIQLTGLEEVRVLVNNRVKMSPGKMAAQAIHATLLAYGIPHGRVVVLDGRPGQIEKMQAQVRDAGRTEIPAGTNHGARMLTEADLRTITETGLVPPDRVKALVFALRQQAHEARAAARAHKDGQKSHAAAALRGKARAYDEAAIMVQHIAAGHALHPRRYSAAARRNRLMEATRRLRREAKRHIATDG